MRVHRETSELAGRPLLEACDHERDVASLRDGVQIATSVLVAVTSGCYVAALPIVNLRLAHFGVRSQELNGTQYVLVGAVFAWLGVADLVIEMKPKGYDSWDTLGTYRCAPEERAQLLALLKNRDPLEALKDLPAGIVRDALDVVRELGHHARVRFVD
jgi:hypothetical protein